MTWVRMGDMRLELDSISKAISIMSMRLKVSESEPNVNSL